MEASGCQGRCKAFGWLSLDDAMQTVLLHFNLSRNHQPLERLKRGEGSQGAVARGYAAFVDFAAEWLSGF